MKSYTIESIEQIEHIAEDFAKEINKGDVFAFIGEMGAGKTTFITAVCKALGITDVVNSPTFAIVNEYFSNKLASSIFHFDFYRLNDLSEAYDIGFEDYLNNNSVCFIEWPQRVEELLPDNVKIVKLDVDIDGIREIKLFC